MRIIHTADWHIGRFLNDYPLIEDQRDWFSRFCARLEELQPDALVVAGDIYDRSVPPGEAVALLSEVLRRVVLDLKIETFLIAGNHDSRERLSFGSELLEQSGLHIAGRVEPVLRPISLTRGGLTVHFYLLPYLEPHSVKPLFPERAIRTAGDAVAAVMEETLPALDKSAFNLLAAHGLFAYPQGDGAGENTEENASVGGSEMVSARLFDSFDYAAFGHLHSFRSAGNDRMLYAGSPLKYSVDEANQKKGYLVLDVQDKNTFTVRQESLPASRDVRVIEGSFEELCAAPLAESSGDYVFANLTDGALVLNAMARLKAVYPNIVGLRYLALNAVSAEELTTSRPAGRRRTEEELFGEFYENVTGGPLPGEEEAVVRELFHEMKGGSVQ